MAASDTAVIEQLPRPVASRPLPALLAAHHRYLRQAAGTADDSDDESHDCVLRRILQPLNHNRKEQYPSHLTYRVQPALIIC